MQLGFLSGAFTAAAAVWIAYKVYPLQKEKDRLVQVRQEEAAVLRDFFQVSGQYLDDLKQAFFRKRDGDEDPWEGADKRYPDVRRAYELVSLYAPKEVVAACRVSTLALFQYRHTLKKELGLISREPRGFNVMKSWPAVRDAEGLRNNAIMVARMRILDCTQEEAQQALLPEERDSGDASAQDVGG